MASKGLKSVIMCVLILGLVLEQVQVEAKTKSCCKTTQKRNCYNVCRLGFLFSRETCASQCGCKIISGTTCPPDYPKFNHLPESGEPDAIEYCNLGCKSSVCDTMNDVFIREGVKIDMERCSDECYRFCNGGNARVASVAE